MLPGTRDGARRLQTTIAPVYHTHVCNIISRASSRLSRVPDRYAIHPRCIPTRLTVSRTSAPSQAAGSAILAPALRPSRNPPSCVAHQKHDGAFPHQGRFAAVRDGILASLRALSWLVSTIPCESALWGPLASVHHATSSVHVRALYASRVITCRCAQRALGLVTRHRRYQRCHRGVPLSKYTAAFCPQMTHRPPVTKSQDDTREAIAAFRSETQCGRARRDTAVYSTQPRQRVPTCIHGAHIAHTACRRRLCPGTP